MKNLDSNLVKGLSALALFLLGLSLMGIGLFLASVHAGFCIFLIVLGAACCVFGGFPLLEIWNKWQNLDWDL